MKRSYGMSVRLLCAPLPVLHDAGVEHPHLRHQLLIKHEHQRRIEHSLQELRLNTGIKRGHAAHDHHFNQALEQSHVGHARGMAVDTLPCLCHLDWVGGAGGHGLRDRPGEEGFGSRDLRGSKEIPLQEVVDHKLDGRVRDQQQRRGDAVPERKETLLCEDDSQLLPKAVSGGTADLQPCGGHPKGIAEHHAKYASQAGRDQVRHTLRQLFCSKARLHVIVDTEVDEVGQASCLQLAHQASENVILGQEHAKHTSMHSGRLGNHTSLVQRIQQRGRGDGRNKACQAA
mmetsp:Transcript_63027/g.117917  ORF Transcript_63027/g.117917 Transcript_63027/m.117917 type:complete len:287 (-) Transcript_63027:81-941(-)